MKNVKIYFRFLKEVGMLPAFAVICSERAKIGKKQRRVHIIPLGQSANICDAVRSAEATTTHNIHAVCEDQDAESVAKVVAKRLGLPLAVNPP